MPDTPHVTALRSSKRSPTRATVIVDGRAIASLPLEKLAELGIAVGKEWTPQLASRAAAAVVFDKAQRDALRLLNRRAYSSGELRDRLARREHEPATIDQVVEHLLARGFVDDAAYARAVVEQTLARKPAGRRLLAAKLMQKRLPREVIDATLDHTIEQRDVLADAVDLIDKRLRTAALQRCDGPTRRRRLYSLLMRRGFDSDTASAALAQLRLVDEAE
jgi:regulatory protein